MFTALGHVVDQFADALSPRWGLNRRVTRLRRKVLDVRIGRAERKLSGGGFASAEKSRDQESWLTSRLSPASALDADRPTMIERTDSAVKNFELGLSHVEGRVVRVAGVGMSLDPVIGETEGLITAEEAERLNTKLRDTWELCVGRIGRKREALWELLHLCVRYLERRGEFFLLVGDQNDPLCPVGMKLEAIHPDRVDTPPGKAGDPKVRMGVQLDASNVPIGYYVRDTHPGDTLEYKETFTYYPAVSSNGLPRMIHKFIRYDDGQHRGYPRMQVGTRRLKNADEYNEAELERVYVAACNAAVVYTELPPDEAMEASGAVIDADGKRVRDMSPGQFHYVGATDRVEFNNPSGPSNTFEPFMENEARMFAAGAGTSYELLANNWKGLTYSAGKILWNAEDGTIDVLQLYLTEAILDVWRNFVTRCVISSRSIVDVDQVAFRSEPWHWFAVRVIPPRKRSIDPAREDRNDMTKAEAGIIPVSDLVEKANGQPADKVYARIERDRANRRKHGLEIHMPNMGRDEQGGGSNSSPTQPGDTNEKSSDANSDAPSSQAAGAAT